MNNDDIYGLLLSVSFPNSVINSWINVKGLAAYAPFGMYFDTALELDNTIQFHICTGFSTGTASALCKIHTFAVWYTYESDLTAYSAGLSKVTPFASYLFNEGGSDNKIRDHVSDQYPAYLAPSPNSPQRLTTVNFRIFYLFIHSS